MTYNGAHTSIWPSPDTGTLDPIGWPLSEAKDKAIRHIDALIEKLQTTRADIKCLTQEQANR